ncbi:MAG: hypothetical protein GX557_14660, partial [Chloroflexi bacterium]|nr:hypothetical protein [Chloroflexota bacterium]
MNTPERTASDYYGLRLPDWGPYSKYYAGASRILHDPSHGMLDLVPVIGYVRGKLIIPDVSYDCGCHQWDATADLRYFAYRYELAWKDVEYVDVEFMAAGGADLLAKLTFVNNTPLDRDYVCTLFAVHRVRPYVHYALEPGELWLAGERYAQLVPSPDGPAPGNARVDGARLGLVVEPMLADGMGVGNCPPYEDNQFTGKEHTVDNRAFILGPGARLTWELPAQRPHASHLHLRYGLAGTDGARVRLSVSGQSYGLRLQGVSEDRPLRYADLRWVSVALPENADAREIGLQIDALEGAGASPALVIDGLLLSAEGDAANVAERFRYVDGAPRFDVQRSAGGPGVVLASRTRPDVALGLYAEDERPVPPPPYSDATVTHVYHGDLAGDVQRKLTNDSLVNWDAFNCVVSGDGTNHFAGYNLAPLTTAAHSRREVYVAIAYGAPAVVADRAAQLYAERNRIEAEARAHRAARGYCLPDTPHRLSQQLLMAQLNMNTVYPQHIENGWYIGHTPAKRWSDNALWDSGMHALGLAEYAPERALEIHEQFTTDALLSFWSVFPIHILAFWEQHQRQPDRAALERLYPRLQRLYAYLLGRARGLHSEPDGAGLLVDGGGGAYGIDDYPAKWHVARNGRNPHIASADTSAYAVRAATTLRLMARALGADESTYQQDITRLSAALQTWSWNAASGYYSYVDVRTHERVLTAAGDDYNMGLDGVAPYVAGIGTPAQKRRMLEHLTRDGELWTRYGLTAIARNAPYYRNLGYWNGKVWVPYQWVFWKALLTEGELRYAERIARTALELWRRETDASYNAWELFDARTGMGQGAHQFGGLSGPIAALYHAHYTPGRLNVGLETVVHTHAYQSGARPALFAELSTPFRRGRTGLVAALGSS